VSKSGKGQGDYTKGTGQRWGFCAKDKEQTGSICSRNSTFRNMRFDWIPLICSTAYTRQEDRKWKSVYRPETEDKKELSTKMCCLCCDLMIRLWFACDAWRYTNLFWLI